MASFHFTVGTRADPLYIDACLEAASPEEALAKLCDLVPKEVDLGWQGYEVVGGYVGIHVNRDAIGVQHIDRTEEGPEPLRQVTSP